MFYFVPFRTFVPPSSHVTYTACFRWSQRTREDEGEVERGEREILFKARFTFLRRRHFLPKAPTRIGIRFIYIHIYAHALAAPADEFPRPVKEINALISSFSTTYRPRARGHSFPLGSSFASCGRRLLSGHRRSFATAVSRLRNYAKDLSGVKGHWLPRLHVLHFRRSSIIKLGIIKARRIITSAILKTDGLSAAFFAVVRHLPNESNL